MTAIKSAYKYLILVNLIKSNATHKLLTERINSEWILFFDKKTDWLTDNIENWREVTNKAKAKKTAIKMSCWIHQTTIITGKKNTACVIADTAREFLAKESLSMLAG